MQELKPNTNKNEIISVAGGRYRRLPIKTHVIASGDDITGVCAKYARAHLSQGDALFISERIVAIAQGRAYPITDIKPSPLARLLVRFVHKSAYGIGLGSPWTMELAIREAGIARILMGALASAVTKPFGLRGVFYRVVGKDVNAIDGPCDYTLPPYNKYAKLGPKDPSAVATQIKEALGVEVVIIDANDLGVVVLGKSSGAPPDSFCKEVFLDNPLGQSDEQTPLCIVRKAD